MLRFVRVCPKSALSITCRSYLFHRIPNISTIGSVHYCSTKSSSERAAQPAVQPLAGTSNGNWNPIYHFPGIVLTASIKRLKLYPAGLTGVTVPISLGLAYADILSLSAAQICGSIGFSTTLTLLLFSYLTNNLVGYVYTDDDFKRVKISYVDFNGKRQNSIYSIDDIIPRSELGRTLLRFYFPIKNHDNGHVYRLVHKYGEVYNEKAFQKVFGRD
ncbi:transmembrane protein 186 [Armigeres subalbatus]|uniref:transmembrane protein 186 n=1 Tax=Armigeres subalbatus TaxID=124917 RepID=UPI002ED04105